MNQPTELRAEQPQTEGVWQPKWLGPKGAWVCERVTRDGQGRLGIETWGANMRAPDGTVRFSAGHFPLRERAAEMCEGLNGEANG